MISGPLELFLFIGDFALSLLLSLKLSLKAAKTLVSGQFRLVALVCRTIHGLAMMSIRVSVPLWVLVLGNIFSLISYFSVSLSSESIILDIFSTASFLGVNVIIKLILYLFHELVIEINETVFMTHLLSDPNKAFIHLSLIYF